MVPMTVAMDEEEDGGNPLLELLFWEDGATAC
jgi:hypothetical protein